MSKNNGFILFFLSQLVVLPLYGSVIEYGRVLCQKPGFQCVKIKSHESWTRLFPDDKQRDLVKRLNRTNQFLEAGMVIAVPEEYAKKNSIDFSPLPLTLPAVSEKMIFIDLGQLAFGAYNARGILLKWGPISAGTSHCIESTKGCLTPTGTFRIQRKKGLECYSHSLPQVISGENGGAYMPYCMYFYKGFSVHGSESLPGYHQSHGCVRMLTEDARWLNESFVDLPDEKNHQLGTKVVIKS